MGIYDAPEKQCQPPFDVFPLRSNIAVFGSPMSGKTNFIKTFLVQLHKLRCNVQEEIYIIDFGGNIGPCSRLPYVCAYFDNSSEENIKRVFRAVQRRLEENTEKLNSAGYAAMYEEHPDQCPAHMTLVIENINAFLTDERYESYRDTLTKFCRDGLSKGLTVVVTGADTSGVGRLMTNFAQKIGFSLPADSSTEFFGCKVPTTMRLPGRGVANIQDKYYEFHCFLPYTNSEEETLAQLQKITHRVKRMEAFEKVIYQRDQRAVAENELLVGMEYYEQTPMVIDYERNRCIGIYGKRTFGKTNLLKLILSQLREKATYRFVFLDDGRLQLRPLLEKPCHKDRKELQKLVDQELAEMKETGCLVNKEGTEYYFRDYVAFITFLSASGFLDGKIDAANFPKMPVTDCRNTVFVLDYRRLYQQGFRNLNDIANRLNEQNNLLIFADIRQSEREYNDWLRNMLNVSFLLDNIGEFVSDRGSGHKSIFGEMDAKELKSQYAKCQLGDGYCYYPDSDELYKVKFLKAID